MRDPSARLDTPCHHKQRDHSSQSPRSESEKSPPCSTSTPFNHCSHSTRLPAVLYGFLSKSSVPPPGDCAETLDERAHYHHYLFSAQTSQRAKHAMHQIPSTAQPAPAPFHPNSRGGQEFPSLSRLLADKESHVAHASHAESPLYPRAHQPRKLLSDCSPTEILRYQRLYTRPP